jgi:hypothetical protein
LKVPRSVRSTGAGPVVMRAMPESVGATIITALADLRRQIPHGTVGVIAPEGFIDSVAGALRGAEVTFDRGDTGASVSLIPVRTAKGLEFDAVVLVEPGRIVAEIPNGLRALFVALTRPTQSLTVVHAEALPDPLSKGLGLAMDLASGGNR